MNHELLKKISWQQTERFFYSYSPDWRLIQILAIEKLLPDRFSFYLDIVESVRRPDSAPADAIIAQEVTNGLFFEAISIAVQSAEDLFAMINAGQKPLKFISGMITYSAGKVDNLLKQKLRREDIATMFYFPLFKDNYETAEQQNAFEQSLQFLCDLVWEIQDFYKKYRFFFTQYKHGLSVALRSFGDYSAEQIAERKGKKPSPYLNVFDNVSITKLEPDSTRFNKLVFMPYLTAEIQQNLTHLMKDDNLLRFVSPFSDITIDLLKSIVQKSRIGISTLGNNILNTLKGEFPISLQLPFDLSNQSYSFSFPEEIYSTAMNKKIFIK